jgi:glycosyltransferase involved in cell wall biosynthesis
MRAAAEMPQQNPTVTVIIPTYNSSATLRLALESALVQDLSDLEIWVVGDACTDESAGVVISIQDARVHWVNLAVNSGGPAAPRNEGLLHARGRYIAYLGHDDLWFPDHISGLVDTLGSTKSDFGYSLGVCVGPRGVTHAYTVAEKPALWARPLSPSNWMHRRDLINRIGPWNVRVRLGHDAEFLQRILDAQVRPVYRPRLSAIKFPAEAWRMYDLKSDPLPQEPYLAALRSDPGALRAELLTQAATLFADCNTLTKSSALGLPAPLRILARKACDLYGRQRWPLNGILYRLWRRRAGVSRKRPFLTG